MTHQEELAAAYERIHELEHALKDIRAMSNAGDDDSGAGEFDPFDVIERISSKVRGALANKVTS
ncbi:hypothetical protein ACRQ5Q_14465 [Bradyrhizobium sp. PMVTL-01]|uniref:hypothetical protein n=1 Tax=Bradyrhizobium sp. PMVTL-01 TaxID=3434999 RepID=UPI003F72858E